MTGIAKIILKAGKEKSVLRFHPWIFSSAIQRIDGEVGAGDSVEVFSHKGDWLAWGVFSPQSQIRVRLWSWDQDKPIDNELIRNRLRSAISLRKSYRFFTETNCVRLVYAESDGIPGLIVDQYDQYLVLQSLSWGVERRKEPIVREIVSLTGIPNVFERSDGEARKLEGLRDCKGTLFGAEPPETIRVIENGILFYVDIRRGHKTGFYLDQKVNRLRVMYYVKDKEVLDCFCFSGGMTIPSIVGGAKKLTCIDESAEALDLLTRNLELNQIPREKISINCGDVFQKLREFRDRGQSFDVIILDPPKFAPTVAHVSKASRGYKDINLLALKLLREGGILVTFSCSGGVSLDLFQKIVFGAALDAKRRVKILEYLHQAPDHPVGLNFPEGFYLKGLILVVD